MTRQSESNAKRLDHLDLLKGVAIIAMVFCHPIVRLAFIANGIFRQLGLREIHMLILGVVLSVTGQLIPPISSGSYLADVLLGNFVFTTEKATCFVFFSWYLFVAAGMVFGEVLQEIKDTDRFYRRLRITCGFLSAVYLAASGVFGPYFLSANRNYYTVGPLESAGLLSIDLFVLSTFYFLLKKGMVPVFSVLAEMGRNVTYIYFIHWILLGLIESVFCYVLEIIFPYPLILLVGIGLLVSSYVIPKSLLKGPE